MILSRPTVRKLCLPRCILARRAAAPSVFNCYAGPSDPPPAAATTTGPGRRRRYCRRRPRPGSRRGQRPGRRRRRLRLPARARVQARADGCPVGAPRAVMNIKHPCKPKPVCRGIPTAILLQDGWQDFKCAGITLVYTRYIPGLEIADSEKISLVYPSHILFT